MSSQSLVGDSSVAQALRNRIPSSPRLPITSMRASWPPPGSARNAHSQYPILNLARCQSSPYSSRTAVTRGSSGGPSIHAHTTSSSSPGPAKTKATSSVKVQVHPPAQAPTQGPVQAQDGSIERPYSVRTYYRSEAHDFLQALEQHKAEQHEALQVMRDEIDSRMNKIENIIQAFVTAAQDQINDEHKELNDCLDAAKQEFMRTAKELNDCLDSAKKDRMQAAKQVNDCLESAKKHLLQTARDLSASFAPNASSSARHSSNDWSTVEIVQAIPIYPSSARTKNGHSGSADHIGGRPHNQKLENSGKSPQSKVDTRNLFPPIEEEDEADLEFEALHHASLPSELTQGKYAAATGSSLNNIRTQHISLIRHAKSQGQRARPSRTPPAYSREIARRVESTVVDADPHKTGSKPSPGRSAGPVKGNACEVATPQESSTESNHNDVSNEQCEPSKGESSRSSGQNFVCW